MRHRSSRWLWALPLTLLGGCLLPSFENVAGMADGGEGGSGGSSGTSPTDGGVGADGPLSGAPAGGGGGDAPVPLEPELVPDTYVLEQGQSLELDARSGVLGNDVTRGLIVTSVSDADSTRDEAYDAKLEIAKDGAVTFTPVPEFFGRYVAHYTALAPDGGVADTTVTFIVQPSAVDLTSVENGVGGVLLSGAAGDEAGVALAGLGDVNDDGFDDFALGAPGFGNGAGAVYVVFGGANLGSLQLGSLASSSKETRFAVLAGSGSQGVGKYLAAAGRYDADLRPDILVGSPAGGITGAETDGALHVVYGGAGLSATLELSDLGARGVTIRGTSYVGQQLGSFVGGAGDFDGNQQPDLLAGFYAAGDTQKSLALLLAPPTGTTIDDVEHVQMTEGTVELPSSLCFAGDVNGDGKDDILASSLNSIVLLPGTATPAALTDVSPLTDDGSQGGFRLARANNPTVGASVAPGGDIDGDAQQDLLYCDDFASGGVSCRILLGPIPVGRKLSDTDWSVNGFGSTPALPLVAAANDLNRDGFSDLLLADEESAYVVFGRDAGFGTVNVQSLGADGFSLAAPSGGSISAVATIGDVNGDGYGDFAIGDSSAAGGAGRVYVVLGGPYAAAQR